MSKAEEIGKTYALHKASEKLHDYYDHAMLSVVQFDGRAIENAYRDGYHQAEKDLDISWVKEVSGVKEMKRAKEEALKAYPPRSIAANYDTIARRDAFEYGYLKAEKDLEPTLEDVEIIINAFLDLCIENKEQGKTKRYTDKEWCQEVLKRFKDYKERKVK